MHSLKSFIFCCCLLLTIGVSTAKVHVRLNAQHIETMAIEDAPYLVQLRHVTKTEEYLVCVGALISPQHVLTSANCFQREEDPYNYIVVGGARGTEMGRQRVTVFRHTFHPEYLHNVTDTIDIAIAQLTESMELSRKVNPIQLCSKPLRAGKHVTLAGWGFLKGDTDMTLSSVQMTVPTPETCLSTFNESYETSVKDYLSCASGKELEIGCMGNKAGPAVYKGRLCGYVAYGHDVCPGSKTVVPLTSIPAIRDFIDSVLKK